MRFTVARCARLDLVGRHVRVLLDTDLRLQPGQFALARIGDSYDPYLRRPLFPSGLPNEGLVVDLPAADPVLHMLWPGTAIDLLGPLGLALPTIPARARTLLVADADPAALLPIAAAALEAGGAATLLLGAPYPLETLRPEVEIELGPLPHLVAEFGPAADQIYVHTHPALHRPLLERLTAARAFVPPGFAPALVERAMPCGVGACGACYLKTSSGWKKACVDGPFFGLGELGNVPGT